MVELRKRPAPKETAPAAPPAKRGSGAGAKVKKLADKAKAAVGVGGGDGGETSTGSTGNATAGSNTALAPSDQGIGATGEVPEATPMAGVTSTGEATVSKQGQATKLGAGSVGDKLNLDGFGGTVTTHDNKEVTLKGLVEESKSGVAIFTYPKASTPGCTTQACLFRDNYAPITGAGLSVFGLSTDSEKSNTTFVTKQGLPYPLLCDPKATLTGAIGMAKGGKSTTRGVVVIDKQGTVRLWEQAGPQKTLDAVLEYVKTQGMTQTGAPAAVAAPPAEDPTATEEASKLADPYKKMDEVPLARTPTNEEREAAETAAEVNDVAKRIDSMEEVEQT